MVAKRQRVEWPPLCTQSEFGALVGLSTRTVKDLSAKGILVYHGSQLRTLESVQRYIASLRKAAMGRQGEGGIDITTERAKLAAVQRQREELALAKARDEMMDLNEVSEGWGQFASTIRASVLAIPSRVRSAIPHLTAFDALTVDKICRDVLEMGVEELQSSPVAGSANLAPLMEGLPPAKRKRAKRK
jgi:terminase small subunit / prophage DNA-packing protein